MRRVLLVSALLMTFAGSASASTTTTPITASAFTALVHRGMEGSFSATYRMGGLSSNPYDGAIVTVAQRSPVGKSAWLGGPGDWSYTLAAKDGEYYQWVREDTLVENCVRGGAFKSLHCSGPTNLGHLGGNGYGIAIAPFIPGYAFGQINEAIASYHGPLDLTPSGSGWCVAFNITWCVDAEGRLVSFSASSGEAGPILFLWTSATRLRDSSTAPLSDFYLDGRPSEPFVLSP